jgi:metal-responsive CopG/Arc/MetJ family transcriptional regulator
MNHLFHSGDKLEIMKRVTMTIPDDLADALESFVHSQEARPTLTTVVQAALRQYLGERGFLRARQNFEIRASVRGSGASNVSKEHDRYLVQGKT